MFQPQNDTAVFRVVQVGLEQPDVVEVLGGLDENETVITTGASALRDGDRIILPGQSDAGVATARSARSGARGPARGGRRGADGANAASRSRQRSEQFIHEYSASRHSSTGHDVHDQRRRSRCWA